MSVETSMQMRTTTLFCDDLRLEMGGKLSAMGIYQGIMALPADEFLLPKLVAWTAIELPKAWSGGRVQVRLIDRDQLLTEAQFDITDLPPQSEHIVMNVPLTAMPFSAKVGMVLHISISAPGLNYRSGDLRIVAQDAA